MAKSSLPMPTGGSGIVPKLVSTVIGLAVLVLVVKHPAEAANWVSGTSAAVGTVIDGLAAFLHALG